MKSAMENDPGRPYGRTSTRLSEIRTDVLSIQMKELTIRPRRSRTHGRNRGRDGLKSLSRWRKRLGHRRPTSPRSKVTLETSSNRRANATTPNDRRTRHLSPNCFPTLPSNRLVLPKSIPDCPPSPPSRRWTKDVGKRRNVERRICSPSPFYLGIFAVLSVFTLVGSANASGNAVNVRESGHLAQVDPSASRWKRSLPSSFGQSGRAMLSNTRLSSPIRTSPFGLPKKERRKTVTDFLVNRKLEQMNKIDPDDHERRGDHRSKSVESPTKEDNLSKYYKKKLRRQKQEERLYFKIKKFVVRECRQDSENRFPPRHLLRLRSVGGGGGGGGAAKTAPNEGDGADETPPAHRGGNGGKRGAAARAVRRHVRKRHKEAAALQCDFKLKQIMHQLKRGKLVYMYSLAAYPDRYLRLFHTDVRNCYLASTFTAASGATTSVNNEIQTKDQRAENVQRQWQQYRELMMGPKATKLLQRCLERKIRHKATSLTELGRLLVDLRSIFIGLCSGSFRKCNQDFGVLVEAPIRNLYNKYGRKTRLLGEQIRDILLGCGRSPDFYHCTYASLKEYSSVYKRRRRK